jgi:hypothetical protein
VPSRSEKDVHATQKRNSKRIRALITHESFDFYEHFRSDVLHCQASRDIRPAGVWCVERERLLALVVAMRFRVAVSW